MEGLGGVWGLKGELGGASSEFRGIAGLRGVFRGGV